MLNTLVEILFALRLALSLCSVWSQACTIQCWIFSSEENSIKGALIIHGARFRFVPHCSETENSPLCYFAEELWISFLGLMYSSTTLNQAWNIVDHIPLYCTCNWDALKNELYPEHVPLSIVKFTHQDIFLKAYLFWKWLPIRSLIKSRYTLHQRHHKEALYVPWTVTTLWSNNTLRTLSSACMIQYFMPKCQC